MLPDFFGDWCCERGEEAGDHDRGYAYDDGYKEWISGYEIGKQEAHDSDVY